MAKQLIISISREYGSGGHKVAQELATRLGLPIYDRNLLDAVAAGKDLTGTGLKKYDEAPRNLLYQEVYVVTVTLRKKLRQECSLIF